MNRTLIAAITVAAALVVAGCGSSSSSSSTTSAGSPGGRYPATPASSSSASAPAAAPAGGSAAVTYQNFDASPKTITVKAGTKITWTNKDSAAHNVTSTSAPAGDKIASDAINSGATFSFTPKTAGTIQYVCTFHPQMTGFKVVVTS